jgi:hypothetical protein
MKNQGNAHSSLMQIVMNPQAVSEVKSPQGKDLDVAQVILRAVTLLKREINEKWELASFDQSANSSDLSLQEKEFIKNHVFQALQLSVCTYRNDQVTKVIENMIFNIAQTDFAAESFMSIVESIDRALSDNNEDIIMVGLRALKELCRAFFSEIEPEERKPLNALAEKFLPKLE